MAGPPPTPKRDRLPPGLWLGLGCLLGAATWIAISLGDARGLNALHLLNRSLVRVSLPFFVLAFSASSLARLWPAPWSRRLLRERRGFGLAWAAIHLTHAAAIVTLWQAGGERPDLVTALFGGLGFVLTLAMALTSSDAAVRRLGARGWKRLHTFGIRYLMFIYLFTYFGRVSEGPETAWPAIALGSLLTLVGLRIAAGLKSRRAAGPKSGLAAG